MYNIGEKVTYRNHWNECKSGTISEVSSEMDSYGNVVVEDDVVMYESKKLTAKENKKRKRKGLPPLTSPVYVPVKPKNLDTIYFTIPTRLSNDFVLMGDIIGSTMDGRKTVQSRT